MRVLPIGGTTQRLKESNGRVIMRIVPKLGFYGRFIRR